MSHQSSDKHTPKVPAAYQAMYGKPDSNERTPEQQRAFIRENMHLLEDSDLSELVAAMQASKNGDAEDLKRLVAIKQAELYALQVKVKAKLSGGDNA